MCGCSSRELERNRATIYRSNYFFLINRRGYPYCANELIEKVYKSKNKKEKGLRPKVKEEQKLRNPKRNKKKIKIITEEDLSIVEDLESEYYELYASVELVPS